VQRRLPNGLRVAAVPGDFPGVMALCTVVRVGSRDAVADEDAGFAHLFEHLMFRGTERRPAEAYDRAMQAIGADANATTTADATLFFVTAASADLDTVIELEADRLQHPAFDQAVFQREARAVHGEYQTLSEDPALELEHRLFEAAFAQHPYRRPVIGAEAAIAGMPGLFHRARLFHDRHYRPDNTAVIAAGDVPPAQVLSLVARHYGRWTAAAAAAPEPVPAEPPQRRERRRQLPAAPGQHAQLGIGFRTPPFSLAGLALPALEIVRELVLSERSPLFRRLVLEQQQVQRLYADIDPRRDAGLFLIGMAGRDARALRAAEQALYREIADLAARGPTPAALAAAKAHLRYAFASELITPADLASTLGQLFVLAGDIASVDEQLGLFDRVDVPVLQRVIRQYLTAHNRTVVGVGV
jgi:zinc protease